MPLTRPQVFAAAAGCLVVVLWSMSSVSSQWIGRSLACAERDVSTDAVVLDNLDMDYLLFEHAARLRNANPGLKVLVPSMTVGGIDNHSLSDQFIAVMARAARLQDVETVPVWQAEPISLNAAYRVRDALIRDGAASVALLSPGFRSERSFLIYEKVMQPAGIAVSCVPVFGSRTPTNWTRTWHGYEDVAQQFVKLQYYRFWVLPKRIRNTPSGALDGH